MKSEYQNWLLSEEDHIATLTLNRPDTKNNINTDTLNELLEITASLSTKRDIWVVILRGQGRNFSSGIDLELIRSSFKQSEHAKRELLRGVQECLNEFEALEKPTIAKIHGFCIGGGLILALCCDFRIASQRAIFSLPEVRLGIGVILGTQRVTRVAGIAATKEIILMAGRFNAKTALQYGLVHQILPPEELNAGVTAMANKLLKLPPRTVGISKRMINQGYDLTLQDSQKFDIDAQMEVFDSPDIIEAIESYVDKRQPRFTGE